MSRVTLALVSRIRSIFCATCRAGGAAAQASGGTRDEDRQKRVGMRRSEKSGLERIMLGRVRPGSTEARGGSYARERQGKRMKGGGGAEAQERSGDDACRACCLAESVMGMAQDRASERASGREETCCSREHGQHEAQTQAQTRTMSEREGSMAQCSSSERRALERRRDRINLSVRVTATAGASAESGAPTP